MTSPPPPPFPPPPPPPHRITATAATVTTWQVLDSAWLAIPGLVWVVVAYNIYQYGVDMGRM